MKSVSLTIRFRPYELAMLDKICDSHLNRRGRASMVRYLIVREARRRSKLRTSVVADSEIATEHRIGRPRKELAIGCERR